MMPFPTLESQSEKSVSAKLSLLGYDNLPLDDDTDPDTKEEAMAIRP